MTRRRESIVLLAIIALGTVARCYGIIERSIWFDESFSWRITRYPLSEMLERVKRDVHPPLYYLTLKGWTSLGGDGVATMRGLSVLWASACVGGVWMLTREAYRRRPLQNGLPLLAAAMVATSIFQIRYGWEVRMYAQGAALWAVSAWILLRALREPVRLRWWFGWSCAAAAFAYTHYYALFSLAMQGLFVVGWLATMPASRERTRTAVFAIIAAVTACAMYAPWIPSFLAQRAEVQESFWTWPINRWSVPFVVHQMLLGGPATDTMNPGLEKTAAAGCTAAVVLVLVRLLLYGAAAERFFALSAAGPVCLAVTISLIGGQSIISFRYFTFAQIGLLLALASWVAGFGCHSIRRPAIVMLLLVNIGATARFLVELRKTPHPGLRMACRYLAQHRAADEPIVVGNSRVFFPMLYYMAGAPPPRLWNVPDRIEHFGGRQVLEPSDLIEFESIWQYGSPVVWVVDTTGFGSMNVPAPAEWAPQSILFFPETFWWQGEIAVKRYSRCVTIGHESG